MLFPNQETYRILATGGALKWRKSGILASEHHIWLHRSPRKLFCVHSIELLILHFHLPGFVKIWHTACSTASETSIFLQTHKWNFSIKNQQFRTFGKKFEISTFPELYRASYGIFRQTLVGGSVKWVLLWNPHKIFFLATGGARSGAERLKSHFFFIWVLHRSPIFDMSPDSGRRHQNWLPTTRVCHLDLRKKNRDTFWSKPPPELEKWQIWTRIYRARVAKVSFKTLLQPRFSQDPHKIANCFWPCGVRLWEWVRSKAETSTRPMTCKRSLLNEIWLIWVISKFQISAEIAEISTPRPTAKLKYSSFLHEIQILQAVCGAQSWEWVHSKAESSVLPATC